MDRLSTLEKEIEAMRKALSDRENELYSLKKVWLSSGQQPVEQYYTDPLPTYKPTSSESSLPRWAIERYSRQILLPDIGVLGQEKLCGARVLVVGAGGLGCPVASYLAGAGVGEIGIVDYDIVEVTNIHRQLLHGEQDQYMNKVESAANALRRINSNITITPYNIQLNSSVCLDIVSRYNIVIDCSDNVPTRYLLNDACVLLKLPLISGSALKMEGQVTIYGYRAEKNSNEKDLTYQGPCYRCLFPTPPPPETVGSCSANGVAGPVAGIVGCIQALEAIKLIVGKSHKNLLVGRMLILDGEDTSFRTVKLRLKSPDCATCSDNATVTQLLDYETFCRTKAKEKDLDLNILPEDNRMSPKELFELIKSETKLDKCHLLVDVRSEPEFNMCRIDGAVNYPIDRFNDQDRFESFLDQIKEYRQATFICRRGNDSQVAAQKILDRMEESSVKVKDVIGGLHGWSKSVDKDFPIY